jgi:hypothetical protein
MSPESEPASGLAKRLMLQPPGAGPGALPSSTRTGSGSRGRVAQSPALKQAIAVFNSGSTSLNFGAYALDEVAEPAAALSLPCAGRVYISRQLLKFAPDARRAIVAHLGGGASLCAMHGGSSVETTMGFSTHSGLPMATRPGDVPLTALLYLLLSKRFAKRGGGTDVTKQAKAVESTVSEVKSCRGRPHHSVRRRTPVGP